MNRMILIAALGLSACVEPGHTGEAAPITSADMAQMDWILSLVDDKPALYSATLNLSEPGKLRGEGPCNRYFGSVIREGRMFAPGMFSYTKMACEHITAETAFFQAMQGITTAQEGAGTLVLSGSGTELHFVRPVH
jgi:heat shock protein HslJ